VQLAIGPNHIGMDLYSFNLHILNAKNEPESYVDVSVVVVTSSENKKQTNCQ